MLSFIFRYVLRAILTTLSVHAKMCLQCDHPVIFGNFPSKMMVVHTGRCRAARSVFYCMFSLTHQQLLFILKLPENLVFLAAAMFAWCISPGAQFDIC